MAAGPPDSDADFGRVRVIVRTRPTCRFAYELLDLGDDGKTVSISYPKNSDQIQGFVNNLQKSWVFKLDRVLHDASQEEVYHCCAENIVSRVLEGYNGTIFAYGQTGAGKTYTMTGLTSNYGFRGVIPRAVTQVFREIEARQHDFSTTVRVSYLEIYNDNIRDLLSTLPGGGTSSARSTKAPHHGLTVTEEGGDAFVKGLSVRPVRNEEDALNLLFEGELNRTIGEHSLNRHSSRSHCVYTMYVESRSRVQSCSAYTTSKLNLVDLAGSERLSKTKSVGKIEREAKYINKSLSFLEQVVLALTERKRLDHIPYRQSKLTHLLKDSIGGNCSTLMIANIWAEPEQMEETMSTLKFGTRLMRVVNIPKKNEAHSPEVLVKKYEDEINSLRMELAMHDTLAGKSSTRYEPLADVELQDIDHQIKLYVNGVIPDLEIRSLRQVKGIFSRFKNLVLSGEMSPGPITSAGSNATPTGTPSEAVAPKRSVVSRSKGKSQHTKVSQLAPPSTASETAGDTESLTFENKVGESDGMGFALGGVTSPDKSRKSITKSNISISISSKSKLSVQQQPLQQNREEVKIALDTTEDGQFSSHSGGSDPDHLPPPPQTPPPKEEEFEKFKKGRGQKIHEALLSNKEQLHAKKKECVELVSEINQIKRDIDKEREFLEKKKDKEPFTTETGDPILDEEEFEALILLKQLKMDYHKKCEYLEAGRACIKTLEQFVDKSRLKLLQEFEEWYRLCYIGGEPLDTAGGGGGGGGEECAEQAEGDKKRPAETDHDKFERLQSALMKKDPSTAAFFQAQIRTERRSYSRKQGRNPGEVVSTIRKPSGVLTFT